MPQAISLGLHELCFCSDTLHWVCIKIGMLVITIALIVNSYNIFQKSYFHGQNLDNDNYFHFEADGILVFTAPFLLL